MPLSREVLCRFTGIGIRRRRWFVCGGGWWRLYTVRALESGTVILEVKDGPYEPTGPEDILEV